MKKKFLSIITLLLIFCVGFAYNLAYAKKQNASPVNTGETGSRTWQAVSRLTYVSGTIVSYSSGASEGPVIKIKVDTCYHSGTDPVTAADYPFKPGQEKSFLLIKKPEINLQTGQKVILYEGQFTSENKAEFSGARVKYYEKGGNFYDMNGRKAKLPPEDYPDTL